MTEGHTISLEQKASLVFSTVGILTYMIAMAEPHWFTGSNPDGTVLYNGLWKQCEVHIAGDDVCESYGESPSKYKTFLSPGV